MYLDPQHYHLVIEAVCQLRRLYQVEAISAFLDKYYLCYGMELYAY